MGEEFKKKILFFNVFIFTFFFIKIHILNFMGTTTYYILLVIIIIYASHKPPLSSSGADDAVVASFSGSNRVRGGFRCGVTAGIKVGVLRRTYHELYF